MSARLVYKSTLTEDLASMPVRAAKEFHRVVRRNVEQGNALARELAQAKSGRHGKAYYKRLTGEMTGHMVGEYGPEGHPKTEFVGAGFRHGVNLDLPNSADVIGPKLAKDAADAAGGLFW